MDATKKQKKRVNQLMHRAVDRGDLISADACERCGKSKEDNGRALDGHHYRGYSDECALVVQWLCRGCHMIVHSTPLATATKARSPEKLAEHARMMDRAQRERDPVTYFEHRREVGRIGARKGNCVRWHGPDCRCWQSQRT